MSKIYAFDLDDTLCRRDPSYEGLGYEKYKFCEPIKDMIEICNKLYDDGNTIIIYTARGMISLGGDIKKIEEKLFEQTNIDLKKWGVKYHKLIMGKLHYDFLIDDKAINIKDVKNII